MDELVRTQSTECLSVGTTSPCKPWEALKSEWSQAWLKPEDERGLVQYVGWGRSSDTQSELEPSGLRVD